MGREQTTSLSGRRLEKHTEHVEGDPSLLEKCFYHGCHYNPPDKLCHFYNAMVPCRGCPNWRSCDKVLLKKLKWKRTFIDYLDYQRLTRKKAWKDARKPLGPARKRGKRSKPSPRPLGSFGSQD